MRSSWARRSSAAPARAARLPHRRAPRPSAGSPTRSSLEPPPTAFELGTRRFGMLIMRLTVLMVLFVLLVNALDAQADARVVPVRGRARGRPDARAAADGGLGDAVARRAAHGRAGTSSSSAWRPSRTSASMDVLCTDKTGTLTEAKISLARHVDAAGARQRARADARLPQQPLRDRASGARSTRRSSRTTPSTRGVDARSTRCRSTSSAAASRCWSTTAPRACWSSRARPRTCCGCRRTTRRAPPAAPPRGTPPRAREAARSSWTRSAARDCACWHRLRSASAASTRTPR